MVAMRRLSPSRLNDFLSCAHHSALWLAGVKAPELDDATLELVRVRQRPGSANGVAFMTIEDESGNAWEKTSDEYKSVLYGSSMLLVSGYIQREGEVVHLITRSLADLSPMLASVGRRDVVLKAPHPPGDEFRNGGPNWDHRALGFVQDGSLRVKGRDFR